MESVKIDELSFGSFTGLKPVGDTVCDKASPLRFAITVDAAGEPWLEVSDSAATSGLPAGDLNMLRELRRLCGSGIDMSSWGIATEGGEAVDGRRLLRYSLWKAPYLVHLMHGCRNIVGADGGHLRSVVQAVPMVLSVTVGDDRMATPRLVLRTADGDIDAPVIVNDSTVLADGVLYTVNTLGDNFASVCRLLKPFSALHLEQYLSIFMSYVDNVMPEVNGVAARRAEHVERAVPTIILEKVAMDHALYMRATLTLDSDEGAGVAALRLTRSVSIDENGRPVIRRVVLPDMGDKLRWLNEIILKSAPSAKARKDVYRDGDFFIIPEATAGPFLLKHLHDILQKFKLLGSDKLREYKVEPATPKLNLRLSSGIDYLEGEAEVTVGSDTMTLADLLAQYSRNRYIKLSDGNRAIVNDRYMSRLQRLFSRRDSRGRVRVSLFDLPEVEDLLQSRIKGNFADHAREVFKGFNGLKKSKPGPFDVRATLRPYQIEGVKWIKYLYDNNLGGCLADDMGLGKTLQTIAVLTMLYPGTERPSLIVMPRSLLFNWEKELEHFAPQLSRTVYYGAGRDLDAALRHQVILTTYTTVRNDIEALKDVRFEYVILDESQNIKNITAQTTQAVWLLHAARRLALSGTPMENNLTELYSLFRFLNPTMFGTVDDFNSAYTYPIHRDGDKDALGSLRRKLFPFIMRRLKRDVLQDLPDRIDQTIYVEMSDSQKHVYEQRRTAYLRQIKETIAASGVNKSQFVMLQALSELRRIASVPESLTDGTVHSPKVDELCDSLESTVVNGHKAVVFFNFVAGIELVGERLDELGISYETMTGSTSAAQRKQIVNRFQVDDDCKVLLMTLKVGGVGLNLTAADTVYIFEPWWNKAAEEQAVNRLHRIGQKNTVNTYSVIAVGTIEEKILQLQARKAELFDSLINADTSVDKHLTEEDIDFILS